MIAPDPRAEERVGSVLHDKWTLERLLGVGGMGAVYAARHRNGARAAVKILSPSMGRIPHVRKRFLHEGYAANRVEHAGAVKVLDDDVIQEGTDEGTAYLVMELLEGESLGDRAKRDPSLGERELLELADGVLAVLEAAHDNGVVHRDLKPDNLFLARDAERGTTQIKVLDFGLARLIEAQELTIAGMAVGTPTYMSPEQAAGQVDKIDGRTDIYALGSILFQLATNKRIHDAAHTLGLVVRMATTPAPKIRTLLPDVSEPFARVVDRALAFVREERYATAAIMRADVQVALRELGGAPAGRAKVALPEVQTSAALLDTVQVPATAAAAAAPSLGEAPREPRPPRRSERRREPPQRTSRAWLVLLLMLGGGGYWFLKSRAPARITDGAVPTVAPSIAPASSAPASPASAPASEPAVDAAAEELADASALDDAGLAALGPEDLDASVDGGEDDDDDEDDDELDASAPPGSPASAVSGHRPGPRPVAKPTKKKRQPRRPGQPRRKRRWR